MPVPGSPILLGPILETSPRIRVRGVLAGATVTVVDDTGAEVARDRAPANGTAVLAVTGTLTTGRTVSARQETATGGASTASPGLPVLAPPPTTPPPVFTVVLDVLSAAVRLDGLVLDADVTVTTAAGDVLARGTADRTSQWFRLGGSPGGPQERVLATQEFPGSARSEEATSEPIIVRSYESLPPPTVVAPRSCDTALMVDGVPATQLLIVRFDTGDELHWWSPGGSFRATLPRPLRGAELEAHTEVPMTGGTSLPTVVGIAPEPVPPAPVPSPFCPETGEVLVEGLVSEATVLFEVYEVEKEPAAPRTPLMEIGASGGRESFRLPHVVGGSGPLMAIEVTQRTCTLTSAPAVAHEFVRPGTPGLSTAPRVPARITEPAYSCSRSLEVVGGATTTSVRSAGTGELRADPFLPSGARMRIPLWAPLVADDELLLEEVGCGAPHDDHVTRVEPAPAPMPAPAVTAPLPGDTAITVGGLIADAVVSVSIDRVPADVFIATGPEAVVTVPPLREGQAVYVAQRLCGSVSDRERPAAVVQKGVLTATAAPDGGPTGSATPVVVHARDGAGLAVSGLTVLVDASPVGVTGTPFAWLPSSAGTHPGTVVGRDRYHDASFTLTATTPPKPPFWSLTLNLAYPAGVEIGTFAWHCTPQGGAPIAGTGAPATIALPATAAAPTVTVVVDALSVTMLLDGARYPVVWSTFQQTTVVVFTKPTMTLGLWVEWTGYFDQAGNAICRLAFAGIE